MNILVKFEEISPTLSFLNAYGSTFDKGWSVRPLIYPSIDQSMHNLWFIETWKGKRPVSWRKSKALLWMLAAIRWCLSVFIILPFFNKIHHWLKCSHKPWQSLTDDLQMAVGTHWCNSPDSSVQFGDNLNIKLSSLSKWSPT